MCEAGCDPRVRSKHGAKAIDLVAPGNDDLKKILRDAEYIMSEGLASDIHGHAGDVDGGDDGSEHDSASDDE